jgi:hypothetical protein
MSDYLEKETESQERPWQRQGKHPNTWKTFFEHFLNGFEPKMPKKMRQNVHRLRHF